MVEVMMTGGHTGTYQIKKPSDLEVTYSKKRLVDEIRDPIFAEYMREMNTAQMIGEFEEVHGLDEVKYAYLNEQHNRSLYRMKLLGQLLTVLNDEKRKLNESAMTGGIGW